jgi:hypothetical protein
VETIAELTARRDAVQARLTKKSDQIYEAYIANRTADLEVFRMEASRLATLRDDLQIKINKLTLAGG